MNDKAGKPTSSVAAVLPILFGEIVVSLLTVGVFALIGKFDYTVIAGVALGSAVTVANFAVLTFSVNRAVDKYLTLRGEREMSDEEAEAFASKHAMDVQNAATRSFMIRTFSMLATLVAAFLLTSWFSPIATAVPLLMFRPVLYVTELITKKRDKA